MTDIAGDDEVLEKKKSDYIMVRIIGKKKRVLTTVLLRADNLDKVRSIVSNEEGFWCHCSRSDRDLAFAPGVVRRTISREVSLEAAKAMTDFEFFDKRV